MATPQTFVRDSAGKLAIVNGSLQLTTTLQDYVLAAIQERVAMFAGEWFLDKREGIPYFKIVSERPDLGLLRSLYRRAVAAVPGVADVTRCEVTFDSPRRELTVLVDCTLTDGEVITAQPYIVPWISTGSTA
jgi:hypothetical protein